MSLFVALVGALSGCSAPVTRTGLVWPSPPEKPRIQFIGILKDDSAFPKSLGQSLATGLLGSGQAIKLVKPYGVAADSAGRVYVTDTGLGKLVVFDKVDDKGRDEGVRWTGFSDYL
jgi:hypothetical protein